MLQCCSELLFSSKMARRQCVNAHRFLGRQIPEVDSAIQILNPKTKYEE
jgi:hypothetical protein